MHCVKRTDRRCLPEKGGTHAGTHSPFGRDFLPAWRPGSGPRWKTRTPARRWAPAIDVILPVACGILRVVAVIVAIVIIVRCLMSLVPGETRKGNLGVAHPGRWDPSGPVPLGERHWTGAMGGCQSGFSHRLPQPCGPAAGRQGSWKLQPLQTKNGTRLNGKKVTHTVPVKTGDVIDLGGIGLSFYAISEKEEREQAMRWGVAERPLSPRQNPGIPDRFPNHDGSAVPARRESRRSP